MSFWGVHSGALGIEWTTNFRREFGNVSSSAEYREPVAVQGYSYARIAERMESMARDEADKASYCLLLSGALVLFAVAGLRLSRADPREKS